MAGDGSCARVMVYSDWLRLGVRMSDLCDVNLMPVTISIRLLERWTTLRGAVAMIGMSRGGAWYVYLVIALQMGSGL